jgi:ribosomal protein S18 acetylase RimI-like enzyme
MSSPLPGTDPAPPFRIEALRPGADVLAALAALLVEVVAHGGSVSFMHPLAEADARAFWTGSLAAAERGERIVLGAFLDGVLAGTVTLVLDCPPNQPHRGEIAKMMTAVARRGRGVASALLVEAERRAAEHGRTLLVLDTATEGGASRLYERHGYRLTGEIPDFALKPHGGLTGTRIYWKRIGAARPDG